MAKTLWKTTLVIWTDYDPSAMEIDALATEAIGGSAYCAIQASEQVEHPETDPQWDGTEFFDMGVLGAVLLDEDSHDEEH